MKTTNPLLAALGLFAVYVNSVVAQAPSYFINQDYTGATGTPSGWADSGNVTYDGTSVALADFTCTSTSPTFPDQSSGSSWSLFLSFQAQAWSGDSSVDFLVGSGSLGTFAISTDKDGKLKLERGLSSSVISTVSGAFVAGQTYNIWVDYDGTTYSLYASTTSTKPGTPTLTLIPDNPVDFNTVQLLGGHVYQSSYMNFYKVSVSKYAGPHSWTKSGNSYTTDGSQADVGSAIADASPGDIINIPAGTFTWAIGGAHTTIDKNITLRGAGTNSTFINLAPTGPYYGNGVIHIVSPCLVSDFCINGAANPNYDPNDRSTGGPSTTPIDCYFAAGWHITRVIYYGPNAAGYFLFSGASSGLADYCTLNVGAQVGSCQTFMVRGLHSVWNTPAELGTTNSVYIENSAFNGYGEVVQDEGSGQAVVRYCTINGNFSVDAHQMETSHDIAGNLPDGARLLEAYDNRFKIDSFVDGMRWIELWSGAGVVFDNVFPVDPDNKAVVGIGEYGAHTATTTPASIPVLDQVGSGWTPQSPGKEPMYIWNNAQANGLDKPLFFFDVYPDAEANWELIQNDPNAYFPMTQMIVPNQDVFVGPVGGTFDGSVGVGRGTKAQMLAIKPPLSGLVGWWKGDGDGSDSFGGDDATVPSGVTYATAKVGLGFNLDGSDSRILVPDATQLNFGSAQDFSIEAWIQPQDNPDNYSDIMTVVGKRYAPNTYTQLGYELYLDGGVLCFQMDDTLAPYAYNNFSSGGPDLRDGNFHHVVVTVQRNSTTGGRFYIDGQLISTFDPTVCPGSLVNTDPLRIGNHPTPGLSAFYKGIIDEVSLYNCALAADKIAAIYKAGNAGKSLPACTPLTTDVAFWVTDEGSWNTTLPANTSGQLYRWDGREWFLYYVPLPYPHPLATSFPDFINQDYTGATGTPSGWTDSGSVTYDGTVVGLSGNSSTSTSPAFPDQSSSSSWSLFLSFQAGAWSGDSSVNFFYGAGNLGNFAIGTYPDGSIQMVSGYSAARGGSFAAGQTYNLWVDYDGATYSLYASTTSTKPGTPTLTLTPDNPVDFNTVQLRGGTYWQNNGMYFYKVLVSKYAGPH